MTQQMHGNCKELSPGIGESSPGCKGRAVRGFGVSKQILRDTGKLVPGAHLIAGPEGSVAEGCVPIPSISVSSPWDS